uniref:G protein-coupled receptor n=1 Tax=Globodera pallida TaxID=36090 RepID=A0A183BQA0_GLOPA
MSVDLCNIEALVILDPWSNIIRGVHCALGSSTLISLVVLIRQFHRSRLTFHGNLMLLIVSVLCLYTLYNISLIGMAGRTLALYFFWPVAQFLSTTGTSNSDNLTTTTPPASQSEGGAGEYRCDALLVPVWLSVLLRLPTYQHALTYPLLHFAIMAERARATLHARTYEREGTRFGTTACTIIWALCATFSVWMVLSTLADDAFSQPQLNYSMISRYNTDFVITLNHVLLGVVVLTAFADMAIMWQNAKMYTKRKKLEDSDHAQYSLSRAYQLNENMVSLQLFLPLDLAFVVTFSIYLFFSAFLRTQYNQIGMLFLPLYELNTCVKVFQQAEYELQTIRLYIQFKCWEPLVEQAEEGQWRWPIGPGP